MNKIKTLGELKKSGYVSKSIKDELRKNLKEKIQSGKPTFEGLHGFENTVIPELERAKGATKRFQIVRNDLTLK